MPESLLAIEIPQLLKVGESVCMNEQAFDARAEESMPGYLNEGLQIALLEHDIECSIPFVEKPVDEMLAGSSF
jgi:hypothetical protein